MTMHPATSRHAILDAVDAERVVAFGGLDTDRRARLGQFGTPAPVARLMASLFSVPRAEIALLDAGAGVGSLTAAAVDHFCKRPDGPRSIRVTAVEADAQLLAPLRRTLEGCRRRAGEHGIGFHFDIVADDFIEYAVSHETDLLGGGALRFHCAIQNPPYRKIPSDSRHRSLLRRTGIEVSNLYAAFVALTARTLLPGGELVAITPRSFCNGPYFQPFRADFLRRMALRRVHVFDSRKLAFGDEGVLQENVIVYAVASQVRPQSVLITASSGEADADETVNDVPYAAVVHPDDPMSFVHLLVDDDSREIVDRMGAFGHSLEGLGLDVSTGRVVDFRAKALLHDEPRPGDVPLIYPLHLRDGGVRWPVPGARKPNALANETASADLLVPAGRYVLVKRFSAKEQRRRIEAAVYDSEVILPGSAVGFENHLNYFHAAGRGLPPELALGLCRYLNSTLVDLYFRIFSGHTQVNATDLRSLPYPSRAELEALGRHPSGPTHDQAAVDALLQREFPLMARNPEAKDPVLSVRKIDEALAVLKELGLPRAQQNVRSALTLLVLLDLRRDTPWSEANAPLLGITEMMSAFTEHYGKRYAPNSREVVRRQTVHQFIAAGLLSLNPDDPARPINSGHTVYQVVPEALALLRQFGSDSWPAAKARFLADAPALAQRYARPRELQRIPVLVRDGRQITLSPGEHNVLVQRIISEFLPRFAPGASLLYVGDTEDKAAFVDEEALLTLGLAFDPHGKFPDVVAYVGTRRWLLLIEAVTSHGPVDAKRYAELEQRFGGSAAGRIYVTAFLTRRDLTRHLDDICWETEVWVADSPGHMIHFDGKRFLGPYAAE